MSGARGDADAPASPFGQYADWYDAFNEDKDYASETEFLLRKVGQWRPSPKTWLDVGCGTGNHVASLRANGVAAEGIDRSPSMIDRARLAHPGLPFQVGSAQGFRLGRRYDVVSLLFHSIDYLPSDVDLEESLSNIAGHLAPDGLLVFDFWNSEAVRRDPAGSRTREATIAGRRLYRLSTAFEERERSLVLVRFEFRWDSPDGTLAHREEHRVRHFDAGELEGHLRRAGMSVLTCEAWMRDRPLGPGDWYGFVCARGAL